MQLIPDKDNPLTNSNSAYQAELHLNASDLVTVIFPDGDEIYISGTGEVYDSGNRKIHSIR